MDSANENNVNIDESDYLVPIPCGRPIEYIYFLIVFSPNFGDFLMKV